MRNTLVIFLVSTFQALAGNSYSQTTKLNLDMRNATVRQVLARIEEDSKFYFLYNEELINVERKVNISFKDESIEEVLSVLFYEGEVKAVINDRHIVLTPVSRSASVQQVKSISGTVKNSDGELLPGVTILVKGTTKGAITNIDGKFSLTDVSSSDVLIFSFIGMKTVELPVGSQTVLNVKLEADAIGIEEVVAVGYGVQKKATLTGAIETVSAETFKDRSVTNPVLALQGQSPGLVVTRTSSRPGNEDLNMQIRGATSVNGGSPLIVIDGAPAFNKEAFYYMNTDDIESISILKDASASIYGSRAANGVILVTTKKGKGKASVEYSGTFKINSIGIKPPTPRMEDYAKAWLLAKEEDGAAATYWAWGNWEALEKMAEGYEGVLTTGSWGDVYVCNSIRFDEMYDTSYSHQHNVSISGSNDKSAYRVSAGYAENVGNLTTAYDGQEQYNGRLSYDVKLNEWFKIETGASFLHTLVSTPAMGLGVNSISYDPPVFPSKNPYGQWYANFGSAAGNRNAVAETVDGGRENKYRDQWRINASGTLNFYKDLSITGSATFDKEYFRRQKYTLTILTYGWFGELAKEKINSTSYIEEEHNNGFYQSYALHLNYNKQIHGHSVAAMAGITAEKWNNKKLTGKRQGFEDNGVYDMNLGSSEELLGNGGGAGNNGLYSYIGRLTYNFREKYLFDLNVRRDGSSKFAKGYRWSNFVGISGGWILTSENFMQPLTPISFVKLRASYGVIGNQQGIGNHDYLSTMGFGTAVFGETAAEQTVSWNSALTTNNRSWERVKNATYGIDFRLLDHRLFGSFDYFTKRNDEMLIAITYPSILGGTAPKSNDGELKTKGWEATLGWKSKIGDFEYNIALNMSNTTNELVYMEGVSTYVAGKNEKIQGYPLNSWFLYQTDGFFRSEEEITDYYNRISSGSSGLPSATNAEQRLRPGDTKKLDLDGDDAILSSGNINDMNGDIKYMGDNAPHYTFGVNLSARYKGFDFTAFFQGHLEQKIMRGGYMAYPFVTVWTNQTTAYFGKTWTEDNTNAQFPRCTANGTRSAWNWGNNDFFQQDSRYIRLKQLVVGYTFSDLMLSKYKITKLRLYFSGSDLFEFTSLKDGWDPEWGESSNNSYPFNRTWSFGINLNL